MSRWFPDPLVFRVGDVAAAESTWLDVALTALQRELDARALKRGTRVACVVTGDAARYRIVPWNHELARAPQRQMLAEHCFKEVYGEVAQGWVVRQHAARHGEATLACAIDAALLQQIDALACERHLKLVSVQPSLMQTFNASKHPSEAGPYWFVCMDALWATALLMSPTEPLHVKQLSCVSLDLAASLDREAFMLGLEGPRVPVHTARNSNGYISGVPVAEALVAPPADSASVTFSGEAARLAFERQAQVA